MRRSILTKALLISAAISVPALACAETDCGNQTVKTAEVVYTIPTPEQVAAPLVVANAPAAYAPATIQAPVPAIAEPAPSVVQVAQVEPIRSTPDMMKQPAPVAAYAALLKNRISSGANGLNLFDYAGAHASGDPKVIAAYADYLAGQNPDAMSEADQIAYWANMYNALTLKVVLENYPVSSIRKIKSGAFKPGPWDRDAITVNGKTLTLNDIEHGILRETYPNPAMVHYMVNCASIGCPNLPSKIWVGETLDSDREQAARAFINSPRGVAIDGDALEVSSIYNWFKEDFGGSKAETLEHFRKFAGPKLKAALDAGAKIDGYDYDWDLNQ